MRRGSRHADRRQECRHGEKAAVCTPRRGASEEAKPANTLTWEFQLPAPWENKFESLKPPRVGDLSWHPWQTSTWVLTAPEVVWKEERPKACDLGHAEPGHSPGFAHSEEGYVRAHVHMAVFCFHETVIGGMGRRVGKRRENDNSGGPGSPILERGCLTRLCSMNVRFSLLHSTSASWLPSSVNGVREPLLRDAVAGCSKQRK